MLRLAKTLLLALLLAAGIPRASAFSLIGPLAQDSSATVWQVNLLGYGLGGDIGGPMNLGEEYRFNLPLLTYGFDESFLNYFGTNGVAEVDKAVAIMNQLGSFSKMSTDLHEFPLDTRRFNYQATALNLFDVKSHTLSLLMEQLGAAAAEQWVWCLRAYLPPPDGPVWTVIKRNFDPTTFEPSSYVNNVLYTYQILVVNPAPYFDAVEFETDPSLPSVTSVSGYLAFVQAGGAFVNATPGVFYTGLTRDDVAALRYLYRPENLNVETAPTNATAALAGMSTGIVGSGQGNPFLQPPGTTNATGTNVTGTNAFVNIALRPGIDKFQFVRVDFDSLVGQWLPLTNVWSDTVITNRHAVTQTLQRALAAPDILFAAADLGLAADNVTPVFSRRSLSWVNDDTINGFAVQAGPGTIVPGQVITFSKIGPWYQLTGGGEADHIAGLLWGSYDGTTNPPVIYPQGASIKALEQLILSGAVNNKLNPYLQPPLSAAGSQTNTTTGTGTTP